MFNVKLESFDPASKPKVIREVKALVPNLTLMDVRLLLLAPFFSAHPPTHRPKSSSSRCPRSSKRTCPRRMPRSYKRPSRPSAVLLS